MSNDHRMPGHCWDLQPGLDGVHCFESPGHSGDHYNTYTRDRWPNREKPGKPPAQAMD